MTNCTALWERWNRIQIPASQTLLNNESLYNTSYFIELFHRRYFFWSHNIAVQRRFLSMKKVRAAGRADPASTLLAFTTSVALHVSSRQKLHLCLWAFFQARQAVLCVVSTTCKCLRSWPPISVALLHGWDLAYPPALLLLRWDDFEASFVPFPSILIPVFGSGSWLDEAAFIYCLPFSVTSPPPPGVSSILQINYLHTNLRLGITVGISTRFFPQHPLLSKVLGSTGEHVTQVKPVGILPWEFYSI